MARNLERRRSLHEVWCDTENKAMEGQYVYYGDKYWILDFIRSVGEPYLLNPADDTDFIVGDIDFVYERCKEVFPHEAKALDILYKRK